jgi:hypothetical protein
MVSEPTFGMIDGLMMTGSGAAPGVFLGMQLNNQDFDKTL